MTTGGEWDIDWSWSCSLEDSQKKGPLFVSNLMLSLRHRFWNVWICGLLNRQSCFGHRTFGSTIQTCRHLMDIGLVSSLDVGHQFNWFKHICERSRDLQNPSLVFSLWDFTASTSVVQIGSPRSLAACDAQGILPKETWWHRRWSAAPCSFNSLLGRCFDAPKELAYKPLELFQLPGGMLCTMLHFLMDFLLFKMRGLDPRVAQLRYEFMEATD